MLATQLLSTLSLDISLNMTDNDKPPTEKPWAADVPAKPSPWTLSPRPNGIPSELDPIRHLLEQYSGVPPEDVDSLLLQTRDKALSISPYGMIHTFQFLNLTHTIQHPLFQSAITRLTLPTSTDTFLDVGCCLGHLPRYLASAHNIPAHRLYGTDIHPGFLDLGYETFRDQHHPNLANRDGGENKGVTYIPADFLSDNETDTGLEALTGKIDIIHASAFFHLFEREDQVRVARRMGRLLRRGANSKGMIFGWNGGVKVQGWERYVLGEGAWRDIWDQVGREMGRRWRVEWGFEEGGKWVGVRFAVYALDGEDGDGVGDGDGDGV